MYKQDLSLNNPEWLVFMKPINLEKGPSQSVEPVEYTDCISDKE